MATCAAAKFSQAQISQLQSLKKGVVSKKEVEIVFSHFNEDMSWSDPYAAIRTTYCQGNPIPGCVPLGRVGEEGHAYLHHIVTNYHRLANWTVFSQAGEPTSGENGHRLWHRHIQPGYEFEDYLLRDGDSDAFFVFNGGINLLNLDHQLRSSYHNPTTTNVEETRSQCPKTGSTSDEWKQLQLPDRWLTTLAEQCNFKDGGFQKNLEHYWLEKVKINMPEAGIVFFSRGALFAVSRDRIHQRPREEYMALLAEVLGSRAPCANTLNEWFWYYIMGRPQAAPCNPGTASRFLQATTGAATGAARGARRLANTTTTGGSAPATTTPDSSADLALSAKLSLIVKVLAFLGMFCGKFVA